MQLLQMIKGGLVVKQVTTKWRLMSSSVFRRTTMSDKQGVLYETRTSQEWLEEVDKWPWQKVNKDTWQKQGTCPRCLHTMDRMVGAGFIFARDLIETEDHEEIEIQKREDVEVKGIHRMRAKRVFVKCNCEDPHEGRPEKESGCGPRGMFDGPSDWIRGANDG